MKCIDCGPNSKDILVAISYPDGDRCHKHAMLWEQRPTVSLTVYPIAEVFTSPQGEGFWRGTLMTFVRLAGCTVGKPFTEQERAKVSGTLHMYQEKCTAWNGRSFPCDTNYKMSKKMTVDEIIGETKDVPHVCITGGEPLMHNLMPLVQKIVSTGKMVHVETSGTKSIKQLRYGNSSKNVWVTVSPKLNYISETLDDCHEIKVLIDEDFNIKTFIDHFAHYFNSGKLWIQPVNDEFTVRMDNLKRCLELQLKYPNIMISDQAHKFWNVR